jgi:hypothetical protein
MSAEEGMGPWKCGDSRQSWRVDRNAGSLRTKDRTDSVSVKGSLYVARMTLACRVGRDLHGSTIRVLKMQSI